MSTIDIVADRLEQLTKRFEAIELQLKSGSTKFTEIEKDAATVRSELDSLKKIIDLKIDRSVNHLVTDIADCKKDIRILNETIKGFSTKEDVREAKDMATTISNRLWMIVIGWLVNFIGIIVSLIIALSEKGG